jgi:hypothetical protein
VDQYAVTIWSVGIGAGVLLGLIIGLTFIHNGAVGAGAGAAFGAGAAGVLLALRDRGRSREPR